MLFVECMFESDNEVARYSTMMFQENPYLVFYLRQEYVAKMTPICSRLLE